MSLTARHLTCHLNYSHRKKIMCYHSNPKRTTFPLRSNSEIPAQIDQSSSEFYRVETSSELYRAETSSELYRAETSSELYRAETSSELYRAETSGVDAPQKATKSLKDRIIGIIRNPFAINAIKVLIVIVKALSGDEGPSLW